MSNGVDLVKDSVFVKHFIHRAASTAAYPNVGYVSGTSVITTSATNAFTIDLTDAEGNFFDCNYIKFQYIVVASNANDYGRVWCHVSPSCHGNEFVNGQNVIVSGGLNATSTDGSGIPGMILYPDKTTAKEEETFRAPPNHPVKSIIYHFASNRIESTTDVFHTIWVTYGHETSPHRSARNSGQNTGEQ